MDASRSKGHQASTLQNTAGSLGRTAGSSKSDRGYHTRVVPLGLDAGVASQFGFPFANSLELQGVFTQPNHLPASDTKTSTATTTLDGLSDFHLSFPTPYASGTLAPLQTSQKWVTGEDGMCLTVGSLPAVSMPHPAWERERHVYETLKQNRFFRELPLRRALRLWGSKTRQQRFLYARRRVGSQLLFLKQTHGSLVREVHRTVFDTTTALPLLHLTVCVKGNGLFHECLQEAFDKIQRKVQSETHAPLKEMAETLQKRITSHVEGVDRTSAGVGSFDSTLSMLDSDDFGQFLAQRKKGVDAITEDEMVASATQFASRLKQDLFIGSCSKRLSQLCRYIVTEGLVRYCGEWGEILLGFCQVTPDAHFAALKLTTPFIIRAETRLRDNNQHKMSPSKEELQRSLSSCLQNMKTTVDSAVSTPLGVDLLAAFRATTVHRNLIGGLTRTVNETYTILTEYCGTLGDVQRWQRWISKEWTLQRETWVKDLEQVTVQDLHNIFETLNSADSAVKARLCNVSIGVLSVNHAVLRSEILPGVAVIKQWCQGILLSIAKTRAERVKEHLLSVLITVRTRHTDLDKWSAWGEELMDIVTQKSRVLSLINEVKELFRVIEVSFTQCPSEIRSLETILLVSDDSDTSTRPLQKQYLDALDEAQTFRTTSLETQYETLSTRIAGLKGELCEKKEKYSTGIYASADPEGGSAAVLSSISEEKKAMLELRTQSETCTKYLALCSFAAVDWEELTSAEETLATREDMWNRFDGFLHASNEATVSSQSSLDVAELTATFEEYEDFASTFHTTHPHCDVCARLQERVRYFISLLPLFHQLASPAMRNQHWNEILKASGVGAVADSSTLTMEDLLAMNINLDACERVARKAAGEYGILCSIKEIDTLWDQTVFELSEHGGTWLISRVDEVIHQLEDHQVQLQAMAASRFISGVSSEVESWEARIRVVSDCLEEWLLVQKSWLYLEFIFSSPDINEQLPEESAMFSKIDAKFKSLCASAKETQKIISIASDPEVLKMLKDANEELDLIQKRLEAYLETKRSAFPRFYFLSNDELLSILSDVRNPASIQPHLGKIFDNIKSVGMSDDQSQIHSMISTEGEEVKFDAPVVPTGGVEKWLIFIEQMMHRTVKSCLLHALGTYTVEGREAWFFNHPAQPVSTIDCLTWTMEVEEAIKNAALPEYFVFYKEQISRVVGIVEKDISGLQRQIVCTLILMCVHARDCTASLIKSGVEEKSHFDWQRQLRYYHEDDDIVTKHCSATFIYGYEYLGNQPRLVITPLTDRAFLTCTGALSMSLGAAPQGPAGTGKTESVKDLGKALARQVVVFNCSDGLNYRTMSRMFSGLAQAGAWACFDEFNRIPLEVLSVVAQQMLEITTALSQHKTHIDFAGRRISLNRNFGVFITMNPGYAGRTELPDNLKALFRPVCLMIPDYSLIAEVMFFSEGFLDASHLARKMVQLYKLSSEQLSKQDHYDFGMRAVKSILVCAGSLKRAAPNDREDMLLIRAMRDANIPKFLCDDTVLFSALITDLFPSVKIVEVKSQQMVSIISETLTKGRYQTLPRFIDKVTQLYDTITVRHGVMTVGRTLTGKSVLLHTLKATLIKGNRRYKGANPSFCHVRSQTLNPKSISLGELYGQVNSVTQEWQDGIFSKMARTVVDESADPKHAGVKQWLVFDGPVDTIWSENLNTVLDDNRMLCLVNGERIKLPRCASFIFEVQDLKVASPATVSRCGMVFLEPYYLDGGWRPAVFRAIELNEAHWDAEKLRSLVDAVVPKTIEFIRSHCTEWIASHNVQLVLCMTQLLLVLLQSYVKEKREKRKLESGDDSNFDDDFDLIDHETDEEDDQPGTSFKRRESMMGLPARTTSSTAIVRNLSMRKDSRLLKRKAANHVDDDVFRNFFVMAFTYSFGGNFAVTGTNNSRSKFESFAKELLLNEVYHETTQDLSVFNQHPLLEVSVSPESGLWVTWQSLVPSWSYTSGSSFYDLVVPTKETVMMSSLLGLLAEAKSHTLLNGPTGVGKSIVVQSFISNGLRADEQGAKWCALNIVFSAQTTANNLQDKLESKLHKKRNVLFGAPPGKSMVLFVDDLNMPSLEVFGTSPPLELVRQLIGQRAFYDKKKLFMKTVEDIVFISACGVPGGGRCELSGRLTSMFHLMAIPELSNESCIHVFSSVLTGFLNPWGDLKIGSEPLALTLVKWTCEIFGRVSKQLLPIPAKSHYTFNLRDIGKVVQGVLECKKESTPDEGSLIRLWAHEATRIFHDRLTDEADREWWWGLLKELLGGYWAEDLRGLLFCDFERDDRFYAEVNDYEKVVRIAYASQDSYCKTYKQSLDLVLFRNAVEHFTRIARIIRLPRGSALLVGVGGSGRQSLSTIAAHISGIRLSKIAISKNYDLSEFRNDLRVLLMESGCHGRPIAFFVTDTQIIDEAMLEDLNNLLNTGEVPNLLQPEDVDTIIPVVGDIARERGLPDTRGALLSLFVQRCRVYLKIILAVSPVGGRFRERLRRFPSLVNCMTIDWFTAWPNEALKGVASKTLSKIPSIQGSDLLAPLADLCVFIHQDVKQKSEEFLIEQNRHNYTTPTSYLALLASYDEMLQAFSQKTEDSLSKYSNGLQRIYSTQKIVDQLKEELRVMQPELEKASIETTALMETVESEQIEAEHLRETCKQSEEATQSIMLEAQRIKDECQAGLDIAMPAFYSAIDALKSLNKSDIIEIRSMTSPPSRVKLVIEAVQLLLNEKPGWDSAKKMMAQSGFIERLREYDKDNIPSTILVPLQAFIENAEFQPDIIKKSSVAAMSLCLWVRALNHYSAVSKDIEPKKEQLRVAESELKDAQEKLEGAQEQLRAVEAKVENLQKSMIAAKEKKESLEEQQRLTVVKLGRAEALIDGLSAEQERWRQSKLILEEEKRQLLGTVLLASACVAYIGPFNSAFRHSMIKEWIGECHSTGIPCSPNFNLKGITEPTQIRQWGIDGLPSDEFSIENATIVSSTKRFPLCVDPQSQASTWIKNAERKRGLTIVKSSDTNFMRTLETAIRLGAPLLLEDIQESIDPALDPVLQRSTYKSSDGRILLKLGDTEVDYDPNFKLYLTTKLPNPHYTPELQIKVTVVNFTVTPKGLEDQLLADVVRSERSDLQQIQDDMVVQIGDAKDQLVEIETSILQLLAAATGNILDDEVLINTLKNSKTTSASITENLHQAERTSEEISKAREKYRPTAERGSILYSSISAVSSINHMYQYSLDFFKSLFGQTLLRTEKHDDVIQRVALLISAVTRDTYNAVCTGLFERDKSIFAFLVATEVLRAEQKIGTEEWKFFIGGGLTGDGGKDLALLEKKVAEDCGEEHDLCGVAESFQTKRKNWEAWNASDEPDSTPLPEPYHDISCWRKLLVLRVLRKDKIVFGVSKVVDQVLGEAFTFSPPFDLSKTFAFSSPTIPIILILTAGTDPTNMFLEYASSLNMAERKSMLSLGQDQGTQAAQLISQGAELGHWVYLQNLHVYDSWMPALESILEQLHSSGSVHPDFRLWLTTMPSDGFPVSILQNCVKATKEPPKGLRANLRDSFSTIIKNTEWDSATLAHRQLIVALTFFHGIIQERRRYGALGWNVRYEWSDSDLYASVLTLQTYLQNQAESDIPWAGLDYLTGVIHYGGRVTDFIDLKCLQALLGQYFSKEVLTDGEYCFSSSEVYKIPAPSVLEDPEEIKGYFGRLPGHEMPETFGLHSNADIVYDRNASKRVVDILAGSSKQSAGSLADADALRQIATHILVTLPDQIDVSAAHPATYAYEAPKEETEDEVSEEITQEVRTITPLGSFCKQEVGVLNMLLVKVKRSLTELCAVVRGEAIMSSEMETIASAFLLNRVPDVWHKVGYLSLKGLSSWVEDTKKRVLALKDWNDEGPPQKYWVPGYSFPQGYMTALLQAFSRDNQIPIDEILFRFVVCKQGKVQGELSGGALTFGYYLEGAAWDESVGALCESVKGVLFTEMPEVYLEPVVRSELEKSQGTLPVHACPLYKVSSRAGTLSTTGLSTNFVLSMDLPSGGYPTSHWVLRGAALLCMLDD